MWIIHAGMDKSVVKSVVKWALHALNRKERSQLSTNCSGLQRSCQESRSAHPERLRALDTMLKFPSTFKKPTLEFSKASSGTRAAVI